MSKDNYHTRSSFPFISTTGELSIVSEAVDDIAIWAPTESVLPFYVTAELDADNLALEFTDSSGVVILKAVYSSGYIKDTYNRVCGLISWNPLKSAALKSSLIGNDPQPSVSLCVSPSVCRIRRSVPLSNLYINGEYINSNTSTLVIDRNSGLVANGVGSTKYGDTIYDINMYAAEHINSSGNINKLKIIHSDNPDDSRTYNIDSDVWLKSEATCDIRVVTTDKITITEISNDKL